MKKILFLLAISLFILQSCNINSEILYHKDAASTTVMDFDVREFMSEMKAMTPDSLKSKESWDIDKLPLTWTSLYDIEKNDREFKNNDSDSIKIMKKIFVKSNKENSEYSGFSLKLDHFGKSDYNSLQNFSKNKKLPVDQNVFNDWDGKTLIINTEDFNFKNIEEALKSKSSPDEASDEGMKTEGMMMFFKKAGVTLTFEKKIKSITGKHDWLQQINDHSVRIEYDIKAMYDKDAKLKNSDKKIIIVTE